MLRKRLITAIAIIPLLVYVIRQGEILYLGVVVSLLTIAAWEYTQLALKANTRPTLWIVIGGVWLLTLSVASTHHAWMATSISLLLIVTTAWHTLEFERGASTSPIQDWATTLAGPIYLGGLGGYLVAMRALPDGLWWTLTVIPSIWASDSGAYLVGRWIGRRPMAKRLSPNKTWEGFAGGLVWGPVFGCALAALWQFAAGPDSLISWRHGMILGLLTAIVAPIGDLGISMMKRQAGTKDTGTWLLGHGGALDRIDSWLVGGTIGYYYINLFVLS